MPTGRLLLREQVAGRAALETTAASDEAVAVDSSDAVDT